MKKIIILLLTLCLSLSLFACDGCGQTEDPNNKDKEPGIHTPMLPLN